MWDYFISAVLAFIGVMIGAIITKLDANGDGKVDAEEVLDYIDYLIMEIKGTDDDATVTEDETED